ncbi:unnamed protein product [Boreogadus saida]
MGRNKTDTKVKQVAGIGENKVEGGSPLEEGEVESGPLLEGLEGLEGGTPRKGMVEGGPLLECLEGGTPLEGKVEGGPLLEGVEGGTPLEVEVEGGPLLEGLEGGTPLEGKVEGGPLLEGLPRDSTGCVTATLRLRHETAATLPCLHFHRECYGSATCVASQPYSREITRSRDNS